LKIELVRDRLKQELKLKKKKKKKRVKGMKMTAFVV
jgi:hypothetical protein